nr:reverse transcriptase domain-containing protein [Tanacetum cinerariifolium]
MSTQSSTRNLFPPLEDPERTIRRRTRVDPSLLNDFEEINMAANENDDDGPPAEGGDLPVPNLRTMEELCQPTLNGRGGPISPIAIQATNFRLKNDMIQQVQNSCQFHGLSGDDANKHLDKFLHVTQSIKVNGVFDDALHMYLFPHSLTRHATAWFDRFPRNPINTFEQMAKMFLGKYIPPSMVTKLRNVITNFRQRLDESLFEAWECYKLSIYRCPNHNMLPVTQIDTFYNGLTLRHRDTINAAAGGTFMKRRPKECYDLIKIMTAHHNDWDTFAQRSESSSSITSSSDPEIVALKAEMAEINKNLRKMLQINQQHQRRPTLVVQVETQVPNFEPVVAPVVEPFEALVSAPKPNPKPSIPYPSRLNDQKHFEKANDQMEKFFQIFQDLNFNICFADALILMPKFASTIKSLLTNEEKLFELARTPLNEHCSAVLLKKLPKKLGDPGKFLILCDLSGMDGCLAFTDLGASINLMPLFVWKKLFLPELSLTCMTLELADRSISRPTGRALIDVYEGKLTLRVGNKALVRIILKKFLDFLHSLLEEFLNDDPSSPPLPPKELKVVELKNEKSYIDEPPVVELKDLPPHLEYAFLERDDKLPVIIAKDLKDEEKTALIKVLKSHKRALAWKLSDIKDINPKICTHKILMEEDFKLVAQHQRRVNPKIHEVIKKEVLKLLDVGLIYPISDSPWVSPGHCVPKKGGFTVVENEENELIPSRLIMGWCVSIDYRKLNDTIHKDHFPLPFMEQMLERLAGNEYYCFLDGFSGYIQIPIDPQDQ